MADKKTESGSVGLQIDAPSQSSSPRHSLAGLQMANCVPTLPKPLQLEEKKYLLAVERGDLANVRRILQRAHRRKNVDINCVDSLGRGALTIAIDTENLEMVELLVIMSVETRDALLQAINAEFVEAVELLLEHEELIHSEGEPYSWQRVNASPSLFTSDITPLILAAHKNNYEILKILLDRGATVPTPHDIRCGCDDCIRQSNEDSLRHSLSRVNEYRALASPSLIALSSNDPLLTAFQLSWELRNLAFAEPECKTEYLNLRRQCQQFAVDLLDQSRSSQELAIILNYDPDAPPYNDGDHMQLARLELAINYKQKKFVAHPNIQQLLAALWYEGVPGFRRKGAIQKLLIIFRVVLFFPFYCTLYMIAPNCRMGKLMRKPFMKFLIHASSYLLFLLILILVSQRAEFHAVQMFGTEKMKQDLEQQSLRQRGNGPSPLEYVIVLYVLGFICEETQEILREGIRSYLRNMWNFIDFSRNSLYCLVALLRTVAYIQQKGEIANDSNTTYIPREKWNDFDPQLIAEGLFAGANIFSALKLVHLFSINPHLGPLQISLGRMVIDIVKFFFIYSLVLFAFACGLNQLLWYYANLEQKKCYHLPNGAADWDGNGDACMKWRRFGNLFESSQSLFWASFGMVGLENFELAGIKSYTRFWGLLMFGSYCVINVIVLLNLLIAMMSNSYAMIDEHSDTEWKFARTKLWMSYFDQSSTLPPPFNVLPSVKWITRLCRKRSKEITRGSTNRRKEDRENRYTNVIRSLVWRYVSAMQRRFEDSAVTEDDINEVKSDISSMRYEMLEVFERNGMDISSADKKEKAQVAKRMKVWERRLMKDFHVAPTTIEEGPPIREKGIARFRRIAKQVVSQTTSHKWTEAVRCVTDTQIGRCRNRESFRNQQNLAKAMHEAKRLVEHSPIESSPCTPIEYDDPTSNTLIALLKNMTEEINEYSSASASDPLTKRDRQNSLTQQLQMILSRSPSPLPPNLMHLAENMAKIENDFKKKSHSLRSTSSQLSNEINSFVKSVSRSDSPQQPYIELSATSSNDANRSKSPNVKRRKMVAPLTPPSAAAQAKFSDSKPRTSLTPLNISAANTEMKQERPTPIKSPPPAIHITRTESDRSTRSNVAENKSETRDITTENSAKFVKRRAPSPTYDRAPSPDIAIARPIPMKMDQKEGMIPPPPANKPHSRASSPVTINQSVDSMTNSSEHLVKGSPEPLFDANRATTSPPLLLRASRKVAEVTTIKRQPKTGWL